MLTINRKQIHVVRAALRYSTFFKSEYILLHIYSLKWNHLLQKRILCEQQILYIVSPVMFSLVEKFLYKNNINHIYIAIKINSYELSFRDKQMVLHQEKDSRRLWDSNLRLLVSKSNAQITGPKVCTQKITRDRCGLTVTDCPYKIIMS